MENDKTIVSKIKYLYPTGSYIKNIIQFQIVLFLFDLIDILKFQNKSYL